MSNIHYPSFWQSLQHLVDHHPIHIDRPKNSAHPKRPDLIYPFDYGELQGTTSNDGHGIDVCLGSGGKTVTAILVTADIYKKDSEIKVLIGCSHQEIRQIQEWYNQVVQLPCILVSRP